MITPPSGLSRDPSPRADSEGQVRAPAFTPGGACLPGGGADWSGSGDALECIKELREALNELGAGSDQATGRRDLARMVSSSLDRIMEEHRGMADELINVYEQLGVIFEVTRKLPAIADESEVIELFVESLRRSFAGRRVFAASRAAEHDGSPPGDWEAVRLRGDAQPQGADECREPEGAEECRENDGRLDKRLAAVLERACRMTPARTVVEFLTQGDSAPTPSPALQGGRSPIPAPSPVLQDGRVQPRTSIGQDVLVAPVFSGEHLVCAIVIVREVRPESVSHTPGFRASDVQLVESLTTFCGDLIRNHRLVREMREMSVAMVRSLVSAVDQKDEYTCGHSLRVGYFATALGRLLNLSGDELQMLQWAALLHDVGKIGIRDDVLKKPGKLTAEEFKHIQEHPVRSHRVVQQVPQLAAALDGVLCHHERFDGSGYPAGLKGEQIPLQARIVQIADVFDALTSSRSYRLAYDWRKALEILHDEAGKTVDPELQQLFDSYIRATLESDLSAPEPRRSGRVEPWTRMVEQANHFAFAFNSADDLSVNGSSTHVASGFIPGAFASGQADSEPRPSGRAGSVSDRLMAPSSSERSRP